MFFRTTLAALVVVGAFAGAAPVQAQTIALPPGPNRNLVYGKCRTCHSLQYPKESAGLTRDGWDGVLNDMEMYGLDIAPGERKKILAYLATYLGPDPPPAPSHLSKETPQQVVSGRTVFMQQCRACHQTDGKGLAGQFPPLAGNPDLFRTPEYPARALLNGLQGPISVGGATFDGQMPSFAFLSNAEIAAVVRYVRTAWGNKDHRPPNIRQLTARDVAAAREKLAHP